MKAFLIFFITFSVIAASPSQWESVTEIRDRHEFYKNDEAIKKPAGAWEVLFSVVYPGSNLSSVKDCVIYRVPGDEPGVLKINTISILKLCEDVLYEKAEREIEGITSLQFSTDKKINISYTAKDSSANWRIQLPTRPGKPENLMSSENFKGPGVVLLSSQPGGEEIALKDQTPCHEISDACEELKPNICNQCSQGWYEAPNGCKIGPKFCGIQACGGMNQPACRRGMVYQRKQKIKYECVSDNSFAYCQPKLKVFCQSGQAFCH